MTEIDLHKIKMLSNDFRNDPKISRFLDARAMLIKSSLPKYIVSVNPDSVKIVYEDKVQKALKKIDEELNFYIDSYYKNIK